MKDRSGLFSQIAYGLAAVLVFVLLCGFFVQSREEETVLTQCPIVILGDSLMGQCRDETSVAELLGERLGRPVFNGAFGGTCMALQEQEMEANYSMELLNMVNLSKALSADDFGAQQTVRSRREITDYFGDTVDELAVIDYQKVEILILAFGINDYHAGIALNNEQNPLDESTYGGALRSVLTTLQKSYPDMRIVLVTPTYAWYRSKKMTCEEYKTGDAYLEEYVEEMRAVAEEFGIETIDLYHDLYSHQEWEDWKLYTEDGLHPNEDGRRLIADRLAAYLQE
ncbi:MAG: SGNH/GDSL hydrolase family protein [Acetatifactor sp.]|nr:SGNH/GDSL hydrolase family protein [Acetatifactor sp.]